MWYNTGIVCYIFSLFVLLLFLSSFFSEDLTVVRIRKNTDHETRVFLFLVDFFIFLWLGSFFWCIFFFNVSAGFLIFNSWVCFLCSFLASYYFGFVSSSRGFLYVSVTWQFLLMRFFSKVSIHILILILAVVFFIVSFSRVYCLEFVSSFVPWLLDSILCAFS